MSGLLRTNTARIHTVGSYSGEMFGTSTCSVMTSEESHPGVFITLSGLADLYQI